MLKDAIQVQSWYNLALPGDRRVYFVGPHIPPLLSRNSSVMAVRRLYNAGLVELAQRRNENMDFEYLVIKRFAHQVVQAHCQLVA